MAGPWQKHQTQKGRLVKFEIKSWLNGGVLFSVETESVRLCLEAAVKAGADLSYARLDRARLDGARLDGARLVGASLVGARLDRASLDRASLDGARLDRASLDRASLVGASLDRASLVGARLDRASLVGARLVGALYAWAFVGWHSHGECGRTLTAIKIKKTSAPQFSCGCFSGTESELRDYIANGAEQYRESRTLCVDTCLTLLNKPARRDL